VVGLPPIKGVDKHCDGCYISKPKCTPFPNQANYRVDKPLELVHGDLCGLVKLTMPSGKNMFLLLVDDQSRFKWISLLKSKCDAVAVTSHP
jgi:hypothetical protein